jgi:mono/diheme cytochrome c family protein
MKTIKIGFILTVSVFYLSACREPANNAVNTSANSPVPAVNTSAPQPSATIDELASAREIYTTSCSNCHKEDGTGGKTNIDGKIIEADDLTTEKMKKMTDAKYFDYIENGVPDEGMPAFKDRLTEQQIKDLVKFIRADLQKQ